VSFWDSVDLELEVGSWFVVVFGSDSEVFEELSARHTREECDNDRVESVEEIGLLVVRCTAARRERVQSIGLKRMGGGHRRRFEGA